MRRRALRPPAVSLTGIPYIGRATSVGMALGLGAISVPVVVGLLVLGGGSVSFVFAVHVGVFGGMGFGAMLGAVVHAARFEDARAKTRTTQTPR